MKIDVDEEFDFGFSAVTDDVIKVESSTKAERMFKMIMPLLNNLLKDSETSEYIHWPNRKEKIESFIEKLKTVKDE